MLKKILAVLVMLYAALAMAAVDVNKGTEAELDAVKGIGPVTSKMILSERKKGNFKSWEDFIERIKGVGEKSAVKLSENGLTVNGENFKGAVIKQEKKDSKAAAKEDRKEAKADKKEAKADARADKKEAKADAKADKAVAKAEAAKPMASAAKPPASAAKK